MASSVYNHRSLQPSGPPSSGPSASREHLVRSFDTIRNEFEILLSDLNLARDQSNEYEVKLNAQINELNNIQQQFYLLESQHNKVRQGLEDEISRLRSEIHSLRQNAPSGSSSHTTSGPGLSGPSGPPGQAPPFPDPYYTRDRDRDLPKRDRERADRDRDIRDRDRDIRDRDRPGTEQRDSKRFKTDRMPDRIKDGRQDLFSPSLSSSSMPKLPPPGAAPGSSAGLPPPPHPFPPPPSSSQTSPLTETAGSGALVPATAPPSGAPGSYPVDDLDPATVPPDCKKEGTDWFVIFNPKTKRSLDVNLVHTLMHESVVCCVRFSADGKYLATGCNRTAQIYDTKTGIKTCVLADEGVGKSGDLYIRSVCFSPDGKFLATGAEDKQIRIWDIAKRRIRTVFDGHQQEIYSLDFSSDGRLIVSGSGDKTARIWDMHTGEAKILNIQDPDALNNDAGVTSVAISPNGSLVAAGSLDTVVRIWDVATGSLVERLKGHKDSVYSVAFTPDGRGLISGSLDKTLKYWDVSGLLVAGAIKAKKEQMALNGIGGPGQARKEPEKSSPCTMNFTGHKDYVLSVAVSHDGQWVVSGSKDRGVQFWDSRSAIVQCMLQGHKNSVISIDLSPSGSVLATGSGDWQARIWSYNTL